MDPLKNCNVKKNKGVLVSPHERSSSSSSSSLKVALDHTIPSLTGTEPKINQAFGKQIRPVSSSTLSPLPFSPSSNSKRSMPEFNTIQQCKKLSKKSSDDSMPYSKNIDLNESVERLWRKHDEGKLTLFFTFLIHVVHFSVWPNIIIFVLLHTKCQYISKDNI